MRVMKTIAVGALVMALAAPVWALTIPTVPGGLVAFNSRNQDQGTGYVWSDTTPGHSITFDPNRPLPTGVTAFAAAGEIGNEDSWGLFTFYQIQHGISDGIGGIQPSGTVYYSNSDGSNSTWLAGVFYGGVDSSVTISNVQDPFTLVTTQLFQVQADDVKFELWAIDKADLVNTVANPLDSNSLTNYIAASRTAANRYTGWVDGLHGVELLSGTSTYFQFTGQQLSGSTFAGHTLVYWNIDPNDPNALWNPSWGLGNYFTDPHGNTADMTTDFTDVAGSRDWSTTSKDLGGIDVIPEPITMIGLLMSVVGVGGYVRRRRLTA